MALFRFLPDRFSIPFDVPQALSSYFSPAATVSADATRIVATNSLDLAPGDHRYEITRNGSFTYGPLNTVMGTVTAYTVSIAGFDLFALTGLALAATTLWADLQLPQGDGLGDQHITGGDDIVLAGAGSDWVLGGTGHDRRFGGDGDDDMFGNAGNDRLFGGSGHDGLMGGHGDDMLDGGAGNDFLKGGVGGDILSGGIGADSFAFNLRPGRPTDNGRDLITDFEIGDVITFGNVDPSDGGAGFTVTQDDTDAVIAYAGGTITVLDTLAADVEAALQFVNTPI